MPESKAAIFLLRQEAQTIGAALCRQLPADLICAFQQSKKPKEYFKARFHEYDAWILVMATGIAVRFLDGLCGDKHTDPAVVVVDEGCHHAVSLLSGHEGGGNDLAFQVGNILGATPVISTATEAVKPLVVGIGCRKGVSEKQVEDAVSAALGARCLAEIRCVATVAAKADEAGLKAFCKTQGVPLRIFDHQDVAARAWVSAPSDWVKATLGLDGVCEPCALMATPRGRLLVPKFAQNGVAVAIVEDASRIAQ